MESGSAPPSGETDAEKIARLESERDAAQSNAPEPGSAAEAPAEPPPNPLAALASSVDAHPDWGFVQHLKQLADDGIKAVLDPSVEKDILGVIAALVADITKVKL